ncbi:amyloid beta A4 precursor protein-binding family B member 1-interacting protein-like [Papio anubis]|uniref:amyloid beta A4 precursor protein-binding family B member 1-interacting protein-like n=1 Tax=Papio anubis TaxID=9555 RepID=UPI0004F22612|nr:amyloid beta A4 precursor protein-binding family B member 1-interacting protein-like [Papio anubis]
MSQALCQKDKLKGPINGTAQPNGQMPQAAHSVSAVLQEAQTHAETSKDRKPALGNHQEPGAPPAPHGPKSSLPLALVQRSWDTICSPVTPPARRLPAATATAASTGRPRAAATPAAGSRAPATAPGLHGAACPPPDFVPAPPAVVKRPPMPYPPNRHEASMFRTNK